MTKLDHLLKRFEQCKNQSVINLNLYAALKKEIELYKRLQDGKNIKL